MAITLLWLVKVGWQWICGVIHASYLWNDPLSMTCEIKLVRDICCYSCMIYSKWSILIMCEIRLVRYMWCYSCSIYVKWTPFYNLWNYVVLPWCKCSWERTRDCVVILLLSRFPNYCNSNRKLVGNLLFLPLWDVLIGPFVTIFNV